MRLRAAALAASSDAGAEEVEAVLAGLLPQMG